MVLANTIDHYLDNYRIMFQKNELYLAMIETFEEQSVAYTADQSKDDLLHQFMDETGESFQLKQCHVNAYRLINYFPDLEYVQGLYCFPDIGIAMHHSWALDRQSNVIDATRIFTTDEKSLIDTYPSHYRGITLPKKKLLKSFPDYTVNDYLLEQINPNSNAKIYLF